MFASRCLCAKLPFVRLLQPCKEVQVNCLNFSHDGKRLVCAQNGDYSIIWIVEGTDFGQVEHYLQEAKQIVFSKSNESIFGVFTVANDATQTCIKQHDLKTKKNRYFSQGTDHNRDAISPDGARIVIAYTCWRAFTFNTTKYHTEEGILHPCYCGTGCHYRYASITETFSADGQTYASLSHYKGGRSIFYMHKFRTKVMKNYYCDDNLIALSHDGKMVLQIKSGKNTSIISLSSGICKRKKIEVDSNVTSVCFSPNSEMIAIGSSDGWLSIFDTPTLKMMYSFRGQINPINNICFSPDGEKIAYSMQNGVVRIWFVWAQCRKQIVDFVLPLCKSRHLSLSTIDEICNSAFKKKRWFDEKKVFEIIKQCRKVL